MDHFAAHHDFLINIGPDKAASVASLITSHAPGVIVELGGYVGYSAIWFASAQLAAWQAAGSKGEKPRYWSLEADPVFAAVAMALVDLAGLGDVVRVVVGNADESLRRLKQEGMVGKGKVDMLFLDHVEELYDVDLKVAWEELGLLRKGALVVADNVLKPGAPRYREFVRGHKGLSTRVIKGLIIPGDAEVSELLGEGGDGDVSC